MQNDDSAPECVPYPDEYAPEPAPIAAAPLEPEVEEDDIVFSEDDVLELTDPLEMEPEPEPAPDPEPVPEPIVAQPEPTVYEAAHEEFEPAEDIAFEEPPMTAPASPANSSPLLSSDAEQAASAAFGALASSMLTSSGSTRTLEDIVSDMLRPMLKEWLDQNLPSVVEDLVREHIDRVARRARSLQL